MSIFKHYQQRFESTQQEEMSLQEYLDLCKVDPGAYANAAERMLEAIGEPEVIDTARDPRLSRIFSNKLIKRYPTFQEFYGMEEAIEQIVSYFKHAAQGLEEKKQILYLLGPVGGGKSSLAEKLKQLIENVPLSSMKKRMDLFSDCYLISSEKTFYEQLNSYIFHDLIKSNSDKIYDGTPYSIDALNSELRCARKALGQYWAFSSQERLAEVREAVKKIHFIPVYGNIFSREFLKSMGNILTHHDAVVHALNLTNVFEYHPKIKERCTPYDTENTIEKPSELADILKFSPQAIIHSSRILRSDKGSRFDSPADHFQALDDSLSEDTEEPGITCITS